MHYGTDWKSEEQLQWVAIDGFKLISRFCRPEGRCGGSAIYVRHSIKCKSRLKLNKLSNSGIIEIAAIDCKLRHFSQNAKNYYIVYFLKTNSYSLLAILI